MGKYQRTKGHNEERRLVNALKDHGIPARRVLEYQSEIAENGVDVEETHGAFVYQCKKGKSHNVKAAYKQMDVPSGKIGVAVINWDRDVTLMCVSEEDWMTIREWIKEVA